MAGVRIHHPELTNCTLLVPHPGGNGRRAKDYHIHLDSNGDSIVSETIWQRLQEAKASGLSGHSFVVLNEVPDPPRLVVGDPDAHKTRTFRQAGDGVNEADLQSIAQSFAPKGVTPRISPPR